MVCSKKSHHLLKDAQNTYQEKKKITVFFLWERLTEMIDKVDVFTIHCGSLCTEKREWGQGGQWTPLKVSAETVPNKQSWLDSWWWLFSASACFGSSPHSYSQWWAWAGDVCSGWVCDKLAQWQQNTSSQVVTPKSVTSTAQAPVITACRKTAPAAPVPWAVPAAHLGCWTFRAGGRRLLFVGSYYHTPYTRQPVLPSLWSEVIKGLHQALNHLQIRSFVRIKDLCFFVFLFFKILSRLPFGKMISGKMLMF